MNHAQNLSDRLIEACEGGKADQVEVLMKEGADPNTIITFKNTEMSILSFAIMWCRSECTKVLLRYNADPNMVCSDGCSPLEKSVVAGDWRSFGHLLDHKDIDISPISYRRIRLPPLFQKIYSEGF